MKRLVVCADGTWNRPDQYDRGVMRPSNVVKLARSIRPQASDGTWQHVFYTRGVGTGSFWDRLIGGLTGRGLGENIRAAYRFLAESYEDGDEIFLFGFSRGAFTVRSTAGLIRKCGLLPKSRLNGDRDAVREAYRIYRIRAGGPDGPEARRFRSEMGCEARVRIQCIGVWDTVGALGIPGFFNFITRHLHNFHDVRLSGDVRQAFHAVSIDDARKPFSPALWEQDAADARRGQVLEQVWFAGVHSNVGGGYEDCGLSDITLRWVCGMAESAGLEIDAGYLATITRPDRFGELRDSRTLLYRLLWPRYLRTIGEKPEFHDSVHQTALIRLHGDPLPYVAPNLLAYLERRDARTFPAD